MKTGSTIGYAVYAVVRNIIFSPILSAGFPGQTLFFTHFAQKNDDSTHRNDWWSIYFPGIFQKPLGLREMRRSELKDNSGPLSPDLNGKEVATAYRTRF